MSKIYTVYDAKALAYLPTFHARSNAEAMRMFGDTAKVENMFSRHPEDFTLFCVGEFDEERGILSPISPHVTLCKLVELVNVDRGATPLEQAIQTASNGVDRVIEESN